MPINPDQFVASIQAYCEKYSIPFEHFEEIINDQKVLPMMRGKGMEFNALLAIRAVLDPALWTVHKLNPNPQPGVLDQDISVIHRKSNIRLGIESKTAVRESMTLGERAKLLKKIPHFKVKCHRSRSNIKLQGMGNDSYRVTDFDVIVTNPTNGMFQGATISDSLELITDPDLRTFVCDLYDVFDDDTSIIPAMDADWRFAIPADIATEEGLIPRTPYVRLIDDPDWRPLIELQDRLLQLVESKWKQQRYRAIRS